MGGYLAPNKTEKKNMEEKDSINNTVHNNKQSIEAINDFIIAIKALNLICFSTKDKE